MFKWIPVLLVSRDAELPFWSDIRLGASIANPPPPPRHLAIHVFERLLGSNINASFQTSVTGKIIGPRAKIYIEYYEKNSDIYDF